MSLPKIRVSLEPVPGFCIKTSLTEAYSYTPISTSHRSPAQSSASGGRELLDVKPAAVALPKGLKVFVNIAWDKNVPAAPDGSEAAIQRAMTGEDVDDANPDGWYVPVVVSEGRLDKDKVGQPCLVFDCVYNPSIKSRTLRDPEFKIFLIELALQRIEAQSRVSLSRQIKTPNIAAKGQLEKRNVLIPSVLYENPENKNSLGTTVPTSKLGSLDEKLTPRKPLIEEVSPSSSKASAAPKSILKKTPTVALNASPRPVEPSFSGPVTPAWSWSKEKLGEQDRLKIVVQLPGVTRTHIQSSSLDVEPKRFILNIRPLFTLDVRLDISDAEIVAKAHDPSSTSRSDDEDQQRAPKNALTLKRQRDLDVEGARAEWRVQEGVLIIYA